LTLGIASSNQETAHHHKPRPQAGFNLSDEHGRTPTLFSPRPLPNLVTVTAYYLTRKALQRMTNISDVPNAQKLNLSPRKLRDSTTNYPATSPPISVDSKGGIGRKVPLLVIRMPGVPKFEMINPKLHP
jgi:hypothetical protein